MQAVATEPSMPDLVETAWKTEGRIRDLEITVAPTMTDLRDARIRVDQIAAELHDTKVKVLEIARQQNIVLMEVGRHGMTLSHMQAELHAVMSDQRQMKAEISGLKTEVGGLKTEVGEVKTILRCLVDHFGLSIPPAAAFGAETQ